MKDRYVVDTNVLIAASAADPETQKDIDATPDNPDLLLKIWLWLDTFRQGNVRMVLDLEGEIYNEYCRKLGFNDFGIQVVMHKWQTASVDDVLVDYDADGYGILPETLVHIIHDLADRKMVAAALSSYAEFNEGCVAFAGDTDWHGWEDELLRHNVHLEPLIEDWSRAKYLEKLGR